MALALDTTSSSGSNSGVSSVTYSHTCTGTNLILVVLVFPGDATLADRTISTVTYAGAGLTKAVVADNGSFERAEIWYKIGPATGANNIVVTAGGTCNNIDVHAISLTGAKQSAQPDNFQGENDTSAAQGSISLTTVDDNCWSISGTQTVDSGVTSIGGGQNQIGNTSTGFNVSSYTTSKTPAGTVTHTYTSGANPDTYSLVMVSISPLVVAEAPVIRGFMTTNTKFW